MQVRVQISEIENNRQGNKNVLKILIKLITLSHTDQTKESGDTDYYY